MYVDSIDRTPSLPRYQPPLMRSTRTKRDPLSTKYSNINLAPASGGGISSSQGKQEDRNIFLLEIILQENQ